ncbi:hypothetical protein [Umezawaea sp. Da 62-37]|uniref:hypothetical protein n=1 Tax=Umezawaea sp. Da 62-37 TaxID=3075927 RepID=UPI0028F71442|nr:hypothetical protein [Umezawaea sp. Da 62-37]WNV90745.1 hypothetical protein RM788_21425 [Umezawaea sp. Da 62-37]
MRYWVLFRILTAFVASGMIVAWVSRVSEVVAEFEKMSGESSSRDALAGVAAVFMIPAVLFAAMIALPFEVYILRKRPGWHLVASVVAVGQGALVGFSYLLSARNPGEDPIARLYDKSDWILLAIIQFTYFYYFAWCVVVILVSMFCVFVPRSEGSRVIANPVGRAIVDAGPTLGYLGVALAGVSVAQAYKVDESPLQLIWPVVVGVVLVVLVPVFLKLYARSLGRRKP